MLEKTLYKFEGGSDGAVPYAGLISDSAGNLYGTTGIGGDVSCQSSGCGTVFKLAPNGEETILHAFTGGNDGEVPVGGLVADGSGSLFGTTLGGGTSFAGTVFRLTPDGTETILYTFQGRSDGSEPASTLLIDGNGDLFGTTEVGGSFNGSDCEGEGCGTVFELEPGGKKIPLYAFQGDGDGQFPTGALVADKNGNLYGTTSEGGVDNCPNGSSGCGTVFEIAPDGTETKLYAFQGGTNDGLGPQGGLIADAVGNFYGTTQIGGVCTFSVTGCGTVFKLAPDGKETLLYKFQGGSDGFEPLGGLIMDRKGNLYGTTSAGGGPKCGGTGCGTVFEVTAKGRERVLYAFQNSRGRHPGQPRCSARMTRSMAPQRMAARTITAWSSS